GRAGLRGAGDVRPQPAHGLLTDRPQYSRRVTGGNPRNPRHTVTAHDATGWPFSECVTTRAASIVSNAPAKAAADPPTITNVLPRNCSGSSTGFGRHRSYWLRRSPTTGPTEYTAGCPEE